MKKIIFGTQRISEHNPQHLQALKEAIKSGIKIIDTSPSYIDGSAQRTIALAFRELEDDIKQNIEIISKFDINSNPTEVLEKSLKDLEIDYIDCLLIENPESILYKALEEGLSKDERLDEMNRVIFDAFLECESLIQNGKIKSYGISSEAFSIVHNNDKFLPYEDLITLAHNAAEELKNNNHGFSTIELPINILESEGLICAKWAKENSLRVIATRPLNAITNNQVYRLADYDESHEYYHHLNELLEVTDNEMLKPLFNLFEELDASKHKFGWIGDYETFLYTQAIPHIQKSLKSIDEKNAQTMLNFIDLFLIEYKKMVAYECSKKTKIALKEVFKDCRLSMQECALSYLLNIDDIDYIAVGMRKPSYVHEIMSLG
ncbi:aldo/keto reductase [Sulfurimonas lithotrophica]|uniref:Aldo/keto reductase n=1 Tax=Sulfurimonas lithotrophica TaxID=2590022 RepID=A0A5P8NYG7_9BACT|nr:aldo/keto reductase [Sulfurimonas lithotrophica]QFR48461.1 aldo/keto reductase [Sulfurimonas lithotrophica]